MAPPDPVIVDLSHTLETGMPTYPSDPPFTARSLFTVPADGYSVHALSLGTHTGTHLDAPAHFLTNGAPLSAYPPTTFVGPAHVADLTHLAAARAPIDEATIASALAALRLPPRAILLLRTGWDRHWGTPRYFEHPFLTRAAAACIAAAGVRLVGFDTLSPDETRRDLESAETHIDFGAHEVLLGAGIVIAENLANLGAIQDPPDPEHGARWMVSLPPLKLGSDAGDGAPVRAFAWAA